MNVELRWRAILASAGLALLAGCVSTKTVPVNKSALTPYQGKSLAIARRDKPSFAAQTAGKAMFGLIGAAAMISAGNEIVEKNHVDDPANYIADKLAADFATASQLTLVDRNSVVAKPTDAPALVKLYPDVDLLLDVRTINRSFLYFPTDWNSYRVVYSVKARVIDARKGKVLAESFCARMPEKTPDAPSREQLVADGAARLKTELRAGADHCLAELKTKLAF